MRGGGGGQPLLDSIDKIKEKNNVENDACKGLSTKGRGFVKHIPSRKL